MAGMSQPFVSLRADSQKLECLWGCAQMSWTNALNLLAKCLEGVATRYASKAHVILQIEVLGHAEGCMHACAKNPQKCSSQCS